ncbi:hypothetical protein ACQKPC_18365 [Pseudomonas sp. NPDC089918]|uniref:hypothetical protein n=1 Tax=Pseudomonas sp. NPDC089918 TaxID=3390654 RepID=UPI0030F233D0
MKTLLQTLPDKNLSAPGIAADTDLLPPLLALKTTIFQPTDDQEAQRSWRNIDE